MLVPITHSHTEQHFAEIRINDPSQLPRVGDTILVTGAGKGELYVKVDHVLIHYERDSFGSIADFKWAKIIAQKTSAHKA